MSDPYPQPPARDPRRPFVSTPFTRLARTHAFSVAGDSLFTVGLAGSVFFAVPLGQAQWKVGLYLLLTFAPFAVAAPLIGPVIDRLRGGRRWMIIGSMVFRALLCVLIVRDFSHITFYFEAFLMLVSGKAYLISRAAVVPTTVRNDQELVEANSKLSLLSGVAAVVAAIPGGILLKLGGDTLGPQLTVGLAGIVFAIGAGFATRLPKVVVATDPPGAAEKLELKSAGIRLAASAMGLLRAAVGLLLLVLAFAFKAGDVPLWFVGAAALMAQAGVLVGAALAPRLRTSFVESRIIAGSLAVTCLGGFVGFVIGGVVAAALLSFILGAASGTAKQAFDALVQRDAPDANRGRSFARFETRFQLAWVMGAFIPVVLSGLGLPMTIEVGYLLIGLLMAVGLVSYFVGQRRVDSGTYDWESPSQRLIREARNRVGPGRGDADAILKRDGALAADAALGATTPDDRTAWLPAPPEAAQPEWSPPPGFVVQPLSDAPSTVPPSAAPRPHLFDGEAEVDDLPDGDPTTAVSLPLDQPMLPFETSDPITIDPPPDHDSTVVEPPVDAPALDDPTIAELPFAEPRWRDSRC
jgi:hypothetical protein